MFKLWFTLNDLKQLGLALIAMILVIFLVSESWLRTYLLTHIMRPEWLSAWPVLDIVFGTIGIIIKKYFVRNEPIYIPTTTTQKNTDNTAL